jgi:hypothetical protein
MMHLTSSAVAGGVNGGHSNAGNSTATSEFYSKEINDGNNDGAQDDEFVNNSFTSSPGSGGRNTGTSASSNSENINYRGSGAEGQDNNSGGGKSYKDNGGFTALTANNRSNSGASLNEMNRMKSTTIGGGGDGLATKSPFTKPSVLFKKLANGDYNDIYKSFPIANNLFGKPSYKLLENNMDDMDEITNEDEVRTSSYPKRNVTIGGRIGVSSKRKFRAAHLDGLGNSESTAADEFISRSVNMHPSSGGGGDLYTKIVGFKNARGGDGGASNRYLNVRNGPQVDRNSLYNDESDETSLSGSSLITLRS